MSLISGRAQDSNNQILNNLKISQINRAVSTPNMHKTTTPSSMPNAVFAPVVDPLHVPIVQVKAVRPIKAGEEVKLCVMHLSKLIVMNANIII